MRGDASPPTEGPDSIEGGASARRTKTLPFPAPGNPGNPFSGQGGEDDAPFLLELEREVTWRFIAPTTPKTVAQHTVSDYVVEVVEGAEIEPAPGKATRRPRQ